MKIDGYEFMADIVAKFFNSVRISGWFHHPEDSLIAVAIIGCPQTGCVSEVGLPHGGVENLGPNKGFLIQFLQPEEGFPESAELQFTTRFGQTLRANLMEVAKDRQTHNTTPGMSKRFIAAVNETGGRVLDIGGRARSRVDRSLVYTGAECTVLDILPGDNVDVVGDAHALARYFPPDPFDAIWSVSVFEHLMMPWAVVLQMNIVLKTGGTALIATHQTLGMHDMPWDFWRFSDTAWDALFNRFTGFEIVERTLDFGQFIVPFVYRPDKSIAERAAGYELSVVVVRKTGPASITWPLTPADINDSMYPEGVE